MDFAPFLCIFSIYFKNDTLLFVTYKLLHQKSNKIHNTVYSYSLYKKPTQANTNIRVCTRLPRAQTKQPHEHSQIQIHIQHSIENKFVDRSRGFCVRIRNSNADFKNNDSYTFDLEVKLEKKFERQTDIFRKKYFHS